MKKVITILILVAAFLLVMNADSNAQFTQQGSKLVGSGAIGNANQGYAVSLSGDGNTAIMGGYADNNFAGAAWIYTRTAGVWTQQGNKLVGTGAVGNAWQGISAALSSDGNTAIVGGWSDSSNYGAAWVYTRTAGVWTQQGNKLVGTGGLAWVAQGTSVSLSSDGNTAIVGGAQDNNYTGAVWVFTRTAGVWTQQGTKLVGTGSLGIPHQGFSVSLSSDGNTAISGGYGDNDTIGAAWVFTRNAGVWSQQGSKIVGSGAVGKSWQGLSVSLSSDGNTAMVGGVNDDNYIGAAWAYTRSGGVWTQQGNKLVGTGASGTAWQGNSVSLSYSGDTAIVGGGGDNDSIGAAWIYTRTAGVWSQMGNKLVGTGAVGNGQQGNWVSISADGTTAIVGGYLDNNNAGAAWIYYNSPSGIEEINNRQDQIVVYPNPASTILNFHLSSLSQNEFLIISDIMGTEVHNETLTGSNNNIDVSKWSNGIYFYQIKNDTETLQGKFVVEK
jgi:type IX secretion system substrate protein